MIDLMVSVRSAEEAEAALAGGADWIDVKDPEAGSLGAANAKTLREVAKVVGDKAPLSAAMGELSEMPRKLPTASLDDYCYIKIGLAGFDARPDWGSQWKKMIAQFPKQLKRAAVAYADFANARSPHPEHVLAFALKSKCHAFLLDTFNKDQQRDVFDYFPGKEIKRLMNQAHEAGLITVLAGSLRLGRIGEALEVKPDIVAVRGGVCIGSRNDQISKDLVAMWKHHVTKKQRGPRAHRNFS